MFQAKKRFLLLAVAVLLVIQVISRVIPVLASVTLIGFTAIPGDRHVLVIWQIATGTVSTNAQTSTLTPTPTQARAPTATQDGAYPGPVQTPYPGPIESPNPTQNLTPYPGPLTSVPTGAAQTPGTEATLANNSTQLGGPTSTLRPFPSVTYEFPDATQTPLIPEQSTPGPGGSDGLAGWVNVTRLGPLALILLIWVLLGGWFYLTLRRMQ